MPENANLVRIICGQNLLSADVTVIYATGVMSASFLIVNRMIGSGYAKLISWYPS